MKREIKPILPTMKIKAKDEQDLPFIECNVEIKNFVDVETKFGTKTIATVESEGKEFNVFVNQTSMKNLIEAFGDDDKHFIGKFANLTKEVDPTFDNEMIVFNPVA